MIPKLDGRSREDIIDRIRCLAEAYTPEWKFDAENPDMGTTAAFVYADLMKGTIDKFNRTVEKNMVEFFDRLGAGQLFSEPAGGYAGFSMEGDEEQVFGELIEKGTVLNALTESGDQIVYRLSEPLYIANMCVKNIFYEDTDHDRIFSLYEEQDDVPEDVRLTPDMTTNLQKHRFYFCTDVLDQIDSQAEGVLGILTDIEDEKEQRRFLDAVAKGRISYGTGQGFVFCTNKRIRDNRIVFRFSEEKKPEKITMFDQEGYWFSVEPEDISKIDKTYIKEISLGTVCAAVPADGVFNDMVELSADSFEPFDRNPLPYSAVYFSSARVLKRKGALVEVEFQVRYEKNPINESDENDNIDWKYIMKKSKLKKPKEYDITIKSVVWEYFNGSGWVKLFPDQRYSDVFDGSNDGQMVKLSFVCPSDCEAYYLPSGENHCIRARIATVSNYLKLSGYYITPVVWGLKWKYTYKRLPVVSVMVTDNCLEQKKYAIGEGQYSVKPVYRPAQTGTSLYFGFSMPPEEQYVRILFCMDKSEYTDDRDYLWEYQDGKTWQKLFCKDDTAGLSRTGILSFEKKHRFEKCTFFGKERYWIRLRLFVCEELRRTIRKMVLNAAPIMNLEEKEPEYFLVSQNDGLTCRLGFPNVYRVKVWVNEISEISGMNALKMIQEKKAVPDYDENGSLMKLWVLWQEYSQDGLDSDGRSYILDREESSVIFGKNGGKIPSDATSENVKILYETCSGAKGNLQEGQTLYTEKSSGLISSIVNPLKISGGLNRENISETLLRSARKLRMNGQLSVKDDYEFAACMVERNIIKVKCLSNTNVYGEKEYGAVTLVVLLKDTTSLVEVSRRLKAYFGEQIGANIDPAKFAITKPVFLDYHIYTTVTVKNYYNFSKVQKEITEALTGFFNWTNGGTMGTGWEIGELPDRMDIYNILAGIDDVVQIDSFYMTIKDRDGLDIMEADLEEKIKRKMVVGTLAGVTVSAG